ncbi:hypothetical protein [Kitasatospora camelliae]|uniref:Secreted protein n=1 Tax=Kitasatospora camelliae TaxID=3156397 RepID=A0AAU8JXE8_9ACTN
MPRPTTAQLLTGTLIVVATTVALLAVSGSSEAFEVAVLVMFAVALGTLSTLLMASAAAQRRSPAGAGASDGPPGDRADTGAPVYPQPEYAHRT